MLLDYMEWYNADIIVGSNVIQHPKVKYPVFRKIISRLYQLFVWVFFELSVSDTQVV